MYLQRTDCRYNFVDEKIELFCMPLNKVNYLFISVSVTIPLLSGHWKFHRKNF